MKRFFAAKITVPLWVFLLMLTSLIVHVVEANASPFTPRLNLAYKIAEGYWDSSPANCLTIDREVVSNNYFEPGIFGEATVPDPGEPPVPCHLFLARGLAKPANFGPACGLMVHEYGHLLGFEHSDNPANIMYPSLNWLPNVCWAWVNRFLNGGNR